jgi:hypothetical protein
VPLLWSLVVQQTDSHLPAAEQHDQEASRLDHRKLVPDACPRSVAEPNKHIAVQGSIVPARGLECFWIRKVARVVVCFEGARLMSVSDLDVQVENRRTNADDIDARHRTLFDRHIVRPLPRLSIRHSKPSVLHGLPQYDGRGR